MSIVKRAIYKNGVLYLTEEIDLPEYSEVQVVIEPLDRAPEGRALEAHYAHLVERQQQALQEIIGIGNSGKSDVSQHVDTYLYGRE